MCGGRNEELAPGVPDQCDQPALGWSLLPCHACQEASELSHSNHAAAAPCPQEIRQVQKNGLVEHNVVHPTLLVLYIRVVLSLAVRLLVVGTVNMYSILAVLSLAAGIVASPVPQDPLSTQTETPAFTATSAAQPAPPTSTSPVLPPSNPCAKIAQLFINSSLVVPIVPAQTAYDCLNDVPLDLPSAAPWLDSLKPYIEWQSTTAYLKNPPEGYQEPAFDVWGEFESLSAGVQNGRFANEYEFELAIYRLFQSTHDGHFRYLPNMVGSIFAFGRPISLVSTSIDGQAAPKPYVYSDVLAYFVNGTAEPSAVTQIDGQDAVQFLESLAQIGALQDPDALYNNLFYSLAQASLASQGSGAGVFAGGGRGAYMFPGNTTTLTFENGTSATFENIARVLLPFRNINNGTVLYRTYINPGAGAGTATTNGRGAAATTTVSAATGINTIPPRAGYPRPIVNQRYYNYIAGYYLDEPGYEDVAVLSVTSFVGVSDYQDVAYNFLDQASKDGKKRLIIDTSANGGGTILQGYSLFLNLFPDIYPYGATRFRSHEAFDIIGETVSERIFTYPFDYLNPPSYFWQDFAGGTPFNYRADVDIDNQNFDSWKDKNPPNEFMGDNFTSIIRWNLSDPTNTPANQVQVNGFGNRTGMPPSRPFAPENIVLLYDGYCASTCAIFSEFMTQQAGIKTIAIGGRPNEGQPMQTVGGVKGTNNYPWNFINQLVTDTYALAPDQAGFFNASALYDYIDPSNYEIPFIRGVSNSGQVNVRDGIRQGDESQTPLQFVYEPADCRLWYTAEMTVDVTAMWEKTVDVAWGSDTCVHGSISGKNAAEKRNPEAAVHKARSRLRKRMRTMTADKIAAIEASLSVWTDVNGVEPYHGQMLP